MALIAAGLDFSTLNTEGINLAVCSTVNTLVNPEYPALPFQLGTRVNGTEDSEYIYCTTAGAYAIGSAGYISNDGAWTFTALTTTNATLSGSMVGVLSQCASVTATPTTTLYDGVWVQISGACAGVKCAASTTANTLMYSTATAGVLGSSSGSSAVAITGIVVTTATTPAATEPAVMIYPQVLLT